MANPGLSADSLREALDAVSRYGGITSAANALSIHPTTLGHRYRRAVAAQNAEPSTHWAYPRTRSVDLENGVVLVYSDAHYWPGNGRTVAFRGLIALAAVLRPRIIVANGDLFDGAKVTHHAPLGWSKSPGVQDELAEMIARQQEIADAAPAAQKFRTVGNHDMRFDKFLMANAPQFEGVAGTRLADFLPDWPESWSLRLNDTVIKHRIGSGIHAAWTNVQKSGCSIVTGHTHKLECKPFRGYHAQRLWGVETGTLADIGDDISEDGDGPFEYAEDGPSHQAAGFAVLTWHKGKLLPPEFCEVIDGVAWFRGTAVAS